MVSGWESTRRSNVETKKLLKKEVPVEVRAPEVIQARVIRARVAQMKRDRSRYIASFKWWNIPVPITGTGIYLFFSFPHYST